SKSQKIRKSCTSFMKGVSEFYTQMRESVTNTNWFKLSFLTFVQLSLYYSVPVIIAWGLDLTKVQFIRMISASAFVSMVTAFIPLPGAAFGAEGGFYVFFEMFFPNNTVLMALILWRLLTFYIPLIVGFFVVMYLKFKGMGISLEQNVDEIGQNRNIGSD
ncbi:MAG: YbhN family protein, partial [Bacillota bacterium]|nr:YbhN family protein [Bacillota bacterium]